MPARRTTVVTVLAALLVVVGVLAAALSAPLSLEARPSDPITFTPPPATDLATSMSQPTGMPTALPEPPAWADDVVRVVQVLAVLALVAVAALLLRWASRGWRLDRGPDDDDEVPPGEDTGDELPDTAVEALREGVRDATRALDEDVPPGDAVIGAWVAVETAAARTGVVRDRAQTAGEFTVDVLDATRADPDATRALLRLYLAVRFGAHDVTADDVRRARDLLDVVAQGLVARDDADAPRDADAHRDVDPPRDDRGRRDDDGTRT